MSSPGGMGGRGKFWRMCVAPAASVMARLSYPGKFALILLLFILPTGWMAYQFVEQIDGRIEFAEKEHEGVDYLSGLRALLEDVTASRRLSQELAAGGEPARRALDERRTAMQRDMERLAEVDRQFGGHFGMPAPLAILREHWRTLDAELLKEKPVDHDRLHVQLIGDLRELIKHVGDRSNLILDPDLDSYYLMEAALQTLPERQILLADHQLVARKALANGTIENGEKGELQRFSALLEANVAHSRRGMMIAYGNHATELLQENLDPVLKEAVADSERLLVALPKMIAEGPSEASILEYDRQAEAALRSSFTLWDRTASELKRLLEARTARLVRTKWISLSVFGVAMAVVIYLCLGFYAGVTHAIDSLEQSTQRLVEGDFGAPHAITTGDELEKIGASFGTVAGQLRAQVEQAKEEAERARVAESALRSSEERFQLSVRGSTDGLWDWDVGTGTVYYAPRFKELIGYEDAELQNVLETWESRLHPDDHGPTMAALFSHVDHRTPYDVRYRLRTKSGEYRWFRARGQAVWAGEGRAQRMAGSITDITPQQETEAALKWEQFLLHTLLEYLPDCLYFKDREGRFIRASRSLALQCGMEKAADLVGKSDSDFFPGEYAQLAHADEQEMIRTGTPMIGKEEHPHWASGGEAWVSTTKVPLRDEHGDIIGTFGISHDITAQKEVETRFRKVVDAAPNPLVVADVEGSIQLVNAAAEQLFGYCREEMVGQKIELLIPERLRERHEAYRGEFFQNPVARAMGVGRELKARRRDGSEVSVEIGLSPIRFGDEVVVLSSIHDVSLRKQAEEALLSAKAAAEAANRAKSDFLANMSHEIRTPMNAIIGMTELMLDSELTGTQRDYLATVLESAESLLAIINEILDFSKIEAGHLELAAVPFDLRELIPDILRSLTSRADRKGLELIWHVDPRGPSMVVGDPLRVRQILVNLVGNAIKFTESGEVMVEVQCESASDNEVLLHCHIRDTGIGIPENRQAAIFRPFEQADTSTTRNYGGTGLGLSISTRLVEAMGGRIRLQSEVGQGSTFSFHLRLGVSRDGQAEDQTRRWADLHDISVLVVDDNATNRRVLRETLEARGLSVEAVEGARAAMARLLDPTRPRDRVPLLLSDVNMPETDGYELSRLVRATPELRDIAIILLTSGGRPGDIARAEALRISALLMKPIKQSELFSAIVRAVGRKQPAGTSPVPLHDERTIHSPRRILLAEDGQANQRLAVGLLSKWGHSVVVAENGREALQRLGEETFDLVLMDVNMPEMDGLDATREIRRREAGTGRHIPIIAMTAHALKGDRERCLDAGMDGYLSKPIRRHEFLNVLAPFCAASGNGVAIAPPEPLPGIDWNAILSGLDNDRELLCSVLDACLEECPGLIARLERAVDDGEGPAAASAAHSIKGTLRILNQAPATELLENFEARGRAGDVAGIAADLGRWNIMWEELRAGMESFTRATRETTP